MRSIFTWAGWPTSEARQIFTCENFGAYRPYTPVKFTQRDTLTLPAGGVGESSSRASFRKFLGHTRPR